MQNTFFRLVSILVIAAFLPACGGRLAKPVTVLQLDDESKSCEALSGEIKNNEEEIKELQIEKQRVIKGNIVKGILAPFTIGITLFFLDVRGAPQVELNALRKRTDHLYRDIYLKKCKTDQEMPSEKKNL